MAAFGLGAVWCLVMDLPPRASQGSELFLSLLNAPLLMSGLSKTPSATPEPLGLLLARPWTGGGCSQHIPGLAGGAGEGMQLPWAWVAQREEALGIAHGLR